MSGVRRVSAHHDEAGVKRFEAKARPKPHKSAHPHPHQIGMAKSEGEKAWKRSLASAADQLPGTCRLCRAGGRQAAQGPSDIDTAIRKPERQEDKVLPCMSHAHGVSIPRKPRACRACHRERRWLRTSLLALTHAHEVEYQR